MSHRILLSLLLPVALSSGCADAPGQEPAELPRPRGPQIPPADPDGDIRALVLLGERDGFVDEGGSARLTVIEVPIDRRTQSTPPRDLAEWRSTPDRAAG